MKSICVDAGFLIGLYDETDDHHDDANVLFLELFEETDNSLLVPWPILYETISTRMARRRGKGIKSLERDWNILSAQRRLHLLADERFRDEAVIECFAEVRKPYPQIRALSLADRIVRRILSSREFRISAFITFNPEDFHDVCKRFDCEMIF
jgi:predicted nucleic acid-binding protein